MMPHRPVRCGSAMRFAQAQRRMSMSMRSVCLAVFAAWLAIPAAVQAQVVTHRDVGTHMALKIIAASIAKCEQNGGGLTVAVVDRQGHIRGLAVADKAAPHYVELAERKAYPALTS